MKLPCLLQLRILKLAITSLFSRPYTTTFPGGAPYEPIEQFRGRPRYDEDECIGCARAVEKCWLPWTNSGGLRNVWARSPLQTPR